MRTAACAKCGYSLEGLGPGPEGLVVCPECGWPHMSGSHMARKPRKGYLVGLLISVAAQAVCFVSSHHLWEAGGGEGSLSYQFAGVLAFFAPAIATAAGITAMAVARRGQRARSPWPSWGVAVLTLLVNLLIWPVIFVIGALGFDKGSLLGF